VTGEGCKKRVSNSESTYRAAIIGLGFIGAGDQVSGDAIGGQQVSNLDGTHAEALSKNKRIQLVAGSSRDAGRRERFTQRTSIKTYADWRELLDKERPEIVSVATYSPQHAEITIACAERGVRVIYCEKPIATRVVDADRMMAVCEKAGALLVINHNRRFNVNHRRMRDEVAKGLLGELTSASLRWGNGRLSNVGTHLIDALCMLTGRQVEAVSATLDTSPIADCRGSNFHDPGGWGVMRLTGGLMATVDDANHGKGPAQIILYGTKARATVSGSISIEFVVGRVDQWPSQRAQSTSMDVAVTEIIDWLDNKHPFPYAAQDAVRTLEAIVAFHVSDASKAAWVAVPLSGADRGREVRSG